MVIKRLQWRRRKKFESLNSTLKMFLFKIKTTYKTSKCVSVCCCRFGAKAGKITFKKFFLLFSPCQSLNVALNQCITAVLKIYFIRVYSVLVNTAKHCIQYRPSVYRFCCPVNVADKRSLNFTQADATADEIVQHGIS